jgi:hypothetical protein
MCECCSENKEHKCKGCCGMALGLIGVLMLINIFVWPQWLGIDGWMGFFAIVLIIAGICKSIMPKCHCNSECKTDAKVEELNIAAKETEISASEAPQIDIPEVKAAKPAHKAAKKKK